MQSRFINPRLAPTVLLTCGVVIAAGGSVFAQQGPPQGGGSPGMHMHGGGRGGGFDPVVLEGPPAPDSMAALVQLDEPARQRYATLYENLMSQTKVERDSLVVLRQARRAAMGQGGGPDRRYGMGAGAGMRQDLENQQNQFDKALEEFFTKDQLKKYKDWRDQRRKESHERMQRWRGGTSGPGT